MTPTQSDFDEEEDDVDSCSSFSLQECINEFRARRIRRVSTQSREAPIENAPHKELLKAHKQLPDPAEMDLINQNRSNKEQERKCKPCKNGFCYCFTSDSGDAQQHASAASCNVAGTRARRSRKSETSQVSTYMQVIYTFKVAKPRVEN